ncbi:hypothetical protein V1517DRAFT_345064 [Lipomyces orientalis]|uniref:Uncharacterized protein n=1 Tax=Lipomyces orientalis TaxID=1233043 RepID=A0ACC3TR28_9ASCO
MPLSIGDSEAKGLTIDVHDVQDDVVADGSPVEHENPLGYNVHFFTDVYLVISGVVGTGIFATPGPILKIRARLVDLIYYGLSDLLSSSSKFSSTSSLPETSVPNRYTTAIFSYLNSPALDFGHFILNAAQVTWTTWRERGIGVGVLTSRSRSKYQVVAEGVQRPWVFKVVTLLFISISGLVVLAGNTRVKDPLANLRTRGKELPPTLRISRMPLSKHASVTEELNMCSTLQVNLKIH